MSFAMQSLPQVTLGCRESLKMYHVDEDYPTLYQSGNKTPQIYPKALHVPALLHYNF